MSLAFIKGCTQELPNARITFDKFHAVWPVNAAVDTMRCIEQRSDKSLKGMRWLLLKDRAGQGLLATPHTNRGPWGLAQGTPMQGGLMPGKRSPGWDGTLLPEPR